MVAVYCWYVEYVLVGVMFGGDGILHVGFCWIFDCGIVSRADVTGVLLRFCIVVGDVLLLICVLVGGAILVMVSVVVFDMLLLFVVC